jgi:uncharacterized repeat protein (TIGR03803 family)
MHSRRHVILFAASVAVVFGFLVTSPASATNAEKVLYSFNGSDGAFPYPALTFDGKGNLYGTTYFGGKYGAGTVFELMRGTNGKWTEKVLHNFNFNGKDGAYPLASVTFDGKGNLYGTTYVGGANGYGAVFELTPTKSTWTEKLLHSFNPASEDGALPEAALILDAKGNLYGTTLQGGTYDDGTAFELIAGTDGKWTEKVLHSFHANGHDAAFPEAALVLDSKGNLYGTAYGGGTGNQGAVFQLTPGTKGKWTAKVLHNFSFNGKDGFIPEAALIFDAKGNLYSTTVQGGMYNNGTVFELVPGTKGKWSEKVLHNFNHNTDGGSILYSGLIFDAKGNLYGTTYVGGAYSFGTVFELTPSGNGKWNEKVLHSFKPNGRDGLLSTAGIIFDQHGNLYSTTDEGGSSGNGVVFEISP